MITVENDNPLDFSTESDFGTTLPDDLPKLEQTRKTDYSKIIPQSSPWCQQAYKFFLDWLREIKKQNHSKKKPIRGRAYTNTIRAWNKICSEQHVADVARAARKIMEAVHNDHPELGVYL